MTAAEHLNTLPADLRLTAPPAAPSADVVLIPWNRVRRSPLNPRKVFEHKALVELARNIHARTPRDAEGNITGTGILQNLLGRPNAGREEGVEIAAGERRERAVALLVEGLTVEEQDGEDANGRPVMREVTLTFPDSYPMPFRVEPMTDAELIEAATVENIQRQDMTPMEEADAYLALMGAGRSLDYIATRYGKHPGTVRSRVQLAAGLGKEGRKLLEAGQITLEHAKAIASTTGSLKRSLTEQARAGSSVQALKNLTRSGSFLVENAIFDVPASGLRVEEHLLGDVPTKFADPKKALAAQLEALETLKAQEVESGKWAEVVILPVESEYANLPSQEWVWSYNRPEAVPASLVLTYSTTTGKVQRYEDVARVRDVQAYRQRQQEEARAAGESTVTTRTASGSVSVTARDETGKGVREAAHTIGHQTRAQAVDGFLASHPAACLALAIESLILNTGHGYGALMGMSTKGRKPCPVTPETQALALSIVERFPTLFELWDGDVRPVKGEAIYDTLTAEGVTPEELVKVFTYFTHRNVGAWDFNVSRPSSALNAFAAKIGADRDVQARFTLTDEYLDAYRSNDLAQLIGTMPEGCRPVFKHGCSKGDLKGLILEKAGPLKEAGWLPDLVKFRR